MKEKLGQLTVDFGLLRERWREDLIGPRAGLEGGESIAKRLRALTEEADGYLASLLQGPDRTCLWEDLPDPGDLYRRDPVCLATLRRVERMALALNTPGCWPGDSGHLAGQLCDALEFVYRSWYNEKERQGGEWWHKEIGIPLCLNHCVLLLYGWLEEARRDRYMRTIESYTGRPDLMCIDDVPEVSTGANRAWKCLALAQCGILTEDPGKITESRRMILDIFQYTDSGDGFYPDGSFIQHLKFPYTGGYGISFFHSVTDYLRLLRDTPWRATDKELSLVLEWVTRAYEPFLYRGGFMSMTRGREIAREYSEEHMAGHEIIADLLRLTEVLEERKALPLKIRIKAMILSDTYRNFCENAPLPVLGLAQKLLGDRENPAIDPAPFCGIYPAMDRAVHRREEYAVGISMSSERTGKYESIHDENVRGWYTADGMLYLYNSDLGQYSGGFFPTVNAYRMPGTTVDSTPRSERGVGFGKEFRPHNDWAGGAVLDDLYGAVGMELEAEGSDLRARKSWFLFDREIVCLGAGITCTGDRRIETIVENRKISIGKTNLLQINGEVWNLPGKTIRNDIRHIHLEGLGGNIGYFFPQRCPIEFLDETRTDSWRSINRNSGSAKEITNAFANIVIHHGKRPEDGAYEYVLLPGISPGELRDWSSSPTVEVLRNAPDVQAVRQRELNIMAVNFWQDGSHEVEGLRCDSRASILMWKTDDRVQLAVSDPTWKNERGLTIELDCSAAEVICRDEAVKVLRLRPTVKILVETKDAKGKTFQISLRKGQSATVNSENSENNFSGDVQNG